jgi:CDP-diglyceride synthetase
MMDQLTLLEFLIVSCMVIQAVVVFLALIAYSNIEDRHAWKYFILATTFIVLRRLVGIVRYSTIDLKSLEVEYFLTILVSLFFIAYILKKTAWFKK